MQWLCFVVICLLVNKNDGVHRNDATAVDLNLLSKRIVKFHRVEWPPSPLILIIESESSAVIRAIEVWDQDMSDLQWATMEFCHISNQGEHRVLVVRISRKINGGRAWACPVRWVVESCVGLFCEVRCRPPCLVWPCTIAINEKSFLKNTESFC